MNILPYLEAAKPTPKKPTQVRSNSNSFVSFPARNLHMEYPFAGVFSSD